MVRLGYHAGAGISNAVKNHGQRRDRPLELSLFPFLRRARRRTSARESFPGYCRSQLNNNIQPSRSFHQPSLLSLHLIRTARRVRSVSCRIRSGSRLRSSNKPGTPAVCQSPCSSPAEETFFTASKSSNKTGARLNASRRED